MKELEPEISWKFIPNKDLESLISMSQEGQEYYWESNFYNKECIMQKKEELQKLKEELYELTEKCYRLIKEEFDLERQQSIKRHIRRIEKNNIKIINEKIECLKKELSKPKIYRIKPLPSGNLYIEYETEEEYSRRSITISQNTYPCNKMIFCGQSFSQAYMSPCGSKICWSSNCWTVDIEEIIKHY